MVEKQAVEKKSCTGAARWCRRSRPPHVPRATPLRRRGRAPRRCAAASSRRRSSRRRRSPPRGASPAWRRRQAPRRRGRASCRPAPAPSTPGRVQPASIRFRCFSVKFKIFNSQVSKTVRYSRNLRENHHASFFIMFLRFVVYHCFWPL